MAVYVYVNCLTAMAAFIPAPFLRSRDRLGYVALIGNGILGSISQLNLYRCTFVCFEIL
jgi:hypothetical protein